MPPSRKTFGVGVIGAGKAGTLQLRGWSAIDRARVIGIYDPDTARARRAADAFGVEVFTDPESLAGSPEVNCVDIAAPPESHLELVRVAAACGKAVLCQKPMATTFADATAIVETCERAGVRLMINENWRWRPWYRAARKVIDDGVLGRLQALRLVCRYYRPAPGPQRTGQEGRPLLPIILHLTPHHLDTATYLFGYPESLFARSLTFENRADEDLVTISLGYPGRIAVLDLCWGSIVKPDHLQPDALTIEGTTGTLSLAMSGAMEVLLAGGEVVPIPLDTADFYQRSFTAALRHFVVSLDAGTEFETPGRQNLETMRLVFETSRSAKENTVVQLT